MSTTLREAAKHVLENAIDLGTCFVDEDADFDENEYPQDEDGEFWYHDFWDLKQALAATDPLASIAAKIKDTGPSPETFEFIVAILRANAYEV